MADISDCTQLDLTLIKPHIRSILAESDLDTVSVRLSPSDPSPGTQS